MAKRNKEARQKREPKPKKAAAPKQPSVTLESTQMWSPVQDIKDGIVLTKDGSYVQILEFSPVNFLLYPDDEQAAICDFFGAVLSAFPKDFQIKILSRKADASEHIDDLKAAQAQEDLELCRQMQDQSIQKIAANASKSINRRFFIIHRYDGKTGLRRPSWMEIRSEMNFASYQIAQSLDRKPCENELVSPIGDTDSQIDNSTYELHSSVSVMRSFK